MHSTLGRAARCAALAATSIWAFPLAAHAQDDPYAGYDDPQQQQQQQYQYDPQNPPQYDDPQPQDPQYAQPVDPAAAQYGIGYGGPHPIPYQYGSGFCYIEGQHSHEYAPFDEHLFREANGYYYFNGDPSDFGWNRNTYWFNGNHPVPGYYGGGYCYMSWPHRHFYDPAGIAGLSLVGGYYIYSGVWPAEYYRWRPFYWGYYGGYYRHNYLGNRYYSIRPPAIYLHSSPVRIGAPPGRIFRAGLAPAPAWRPAPRVIGAPAVGGGYRVGAPAPAVGYRPAPAAAVGGGGYRVGAPAPAYHPVAAPAPAYRPAYRPAPAPAFRAAPARGGFRR